MKFKKLLSMLSVVLAVAIVASVLPVPVAAAAETVTVSNGIGITSVTTNDELNAWADGAATITDNGNNTHTVTLYKNILFEKSAVTPISFGTYNDGAGQPTIILDLNGCTITGSKIVISNYGNLVINDSAGGGKVLYDGGAYLVAIQNAGYSLTVNGGEFECQGAGSVIYNATISATPNAITTINGGKFIGNNGAAVATFGTMTINGGEFTGAYGIVSKQNGDGTSAGNITVTSPSTVVNATSFAFVVACDGTKTIGQITVGGGTYNAPNVAGKTGTGDIAGHVGISNGTFSASPEGFVTPTSALAKTTTQAGSNYIVGTNEISNAAAGLSGGDQIEFLSGDASLTGVPDGITVVNSGTGSVYVNNTEITDTPVVTHTHTLEYHSRVEPSHTSEGNIEYWYCTGCQKYFADAAGTNEITAADTVLAKTTEHIADGTGYHYDINGHWFVCVCGEVINYQPHDLTWYSELLSTKEHNGYGHYECHICGYVSGRYTTVYTETGDEDVNVPDDDYTEEVIEIEEPVEGFEIETELDGVSAF